MSYRITLTKAATRELAAVPKPVLKRIDACITGLANDPLPPGVKKLKNSNGMYRVRVSDYRIVYRINGQSAATSPYTAGTTLKRPPGAATTRRNPSPNHCSGAAWTPSAPTPSRMRAIRITGCASGETKRRTAGSAIRRGITLAATIAPRWSVSAGTSILSTGAPRSSAAGRSRGWR